MNIRRHLWKKKLELESLASNVGQRIAIELGRIRQQSSYSIDQMKDFSSNNEEVKNKLNSLLITNDNKVSNKLSSEYVVSYNENANAYEVYNVNELLAKPTKETTNDEVTSNTTQNKVQNTNKVVEVPTINQKIEGDIFLYSYFYLDNNNTSIKDNKLYIYIGLICLVLVNLIVLSFKYGNKEIKAHE